MNIPETLRKAFLFSSFTDEQLRQLADFTTVKKLGRDEHLFDEGEKASAFDVLESGRVKIYRISPEGQEHTLEMPGPGDPVAEAAIFDKETYPAFCQAMEDSVLLRIPKAEFIQLIENHPRIAIQIMHGYSKRLRYFVKMVEELSMRSIKLRLARYLLSNSSRDGDRLVCEFTISKRELASLLGTIPETLSRTLKSLKKENIISEDEQAVIIQDLHSLKDIAD